MSLVPGLPALARPCSAPTLSPPVPLGPEWRSPAGGRVPRLTRMREVPTQTPRVFGIPVPKAALKRCQGLKALTMKGMVDVDPALFHLPSLSGKSFHWFSPSTSELTPPPDLSRPNAPFHRQRLVRPLSKSRTPPRTPSPDPPHPPHFHLPPRSSTPSHLPSLLHPPNLPHRHPLGPPRLLPSRRPPPPRSSNPPKHLYRRLLPLHSPSSLTSSSG